MKRREFLSIIGLSVLTTNSFAKSDEYIAKSDLKTFLSINRKLLKIQRVIGYGNFNIISFDEALKVAKRYSQIGEFTKQELSFIEQMFYENTDKYGFFGKKTVANLTDRISKNSVVKIKRTGHFLFKERVSTYKKMKGDVENIHLTSGVRSVVKQMKLYFSKIERCNGNITKAVNAIVPPAYSYHSIGDFDIGRNDWGWKNFTSEFGDTVQYKEITRLNYIKIRYTKNNKDGVRYEPWHITVV